MDLFRLYAQFKKGTQYFNERYAAWNGKPNPYIKAKVQEFEKQVMQPFDEACKKADETELEVMRDLV